jgi:hypothetical protein
MLGSSYASRLANNADIVPLPLLAPSEEVKSKRKLPSKGAL